VRGLCATLQAGEGQPQPMEKRQGSAADEAGRPTKKVRGHDGQPRAARAASLGTVIAAVEERATRQGSGAMDAAVGRAPTTVEDCLQSSSFGKVRKVRVVSLVLLVQGLGGHEILGCCKSLGMDHRWPGSIPL
jgi:hypothetical protein